MSEDLKMKPRHGVTWTAEEKREWIDMFVHSGQTALQFCSANDLAPATLHFWRQELGDFDDDGGELVEVPREILGELTLTVVASESAQPARGAITMQLPGGARVELGGVDPAWFAQLLRAMG